MSRNPDESDSISFMSALYRVSCPSSCPVMSFVAISKLGLMSSLKKPGLKHRSRPKETHRDFWKHERLLFFSCLFLYWTWLSFCHICELASCSVRLFGGCIPLQSASFQFPGWPSHQKRFLTELEHCQLLHRQLKANSCVNTYLSSLM